MAKSGSPVQDVRVSSSVFRWHVAVLSWTVIATQSCGGNYEPRAAATQALVPMVKDSSLHGSEWQWFVLPEEVDELFRQHRLQIIAAQPLCLRPPDEEALGHLRAIWSGGLVGRAVIEVKWDSVRLDAELSTFDRSARKEYSLDQYHAARRVVDSCTESLLSGRAGPMIEWPPRERVLDGNRLTLEYRVGDTVYGVARANPLMNAPERGLVGLVRCVCDLIRLPQGNVPVGIGGLCADTLT
jgi:hypothetical protein